MKTELGSSFEFKAKGGKGVPETASTGQFLRDDSCATLIIDDFLRNGGVHLLLVLE